MASERTRNVIVGFTLLASAGLLVAAIFALGKFRDLTSGSPYVVHVKAENASGLNDGSKVDLSGVIVGMVTKVTLAPDARTVDIALSIDHDVQIPLGAKAIIGRMTIGTPFLSLQPPAQAVGGQVPRDGSGVVVADPSDSGFIPRSVIEQLTLMTRKLSVVSDDLHDLLQPRPTSVVDGTPGDGKTHPAANISTLVQRIDHLSAGLDSLLNDPKLQDSLRQIVSDVQGSTGQLKEILQGVKGTVANANVTVSKVGTAADKISGAATQAGDVLQTTQTRIVAVSEKLVDTLGAMQKVMEQISKGNGTAGKLVNDPRLYEGLVDVSRSLKDTLDELKVLVRKWKEEGVNLKL